MVICVSMLIGSTFAWFTDSATANVNTIQAGNLEVDLQVKNAEGNWVSADKTTLNFLRKDENGNLVADANILWEPGCTFELPELRIVNKGDLALKYQLVITGAKSANDDGKDGLKLLEVLKFTASVGGTDGTAVNVKDGGAVATGKLDKNGDEALVKISASMDTTAGNEYRGLKIGGISVKVVATQATYEYDSNGNKYDEGAEFSETIAAGKTFTGKSTVDAGIVATNPNAIAVKAIGTSADVTINGGFFDGGEGGNNIGVCAANGAKVTINGGTFTVGGDADGYGNSVVYSQGGTIVINGGFFYTNCSYGGRYYVLNQSNGNPGTITVYGGTFVNYDPSTGDDNLGGNFVAEGYIVTSEKQANGDVWYTVVKGANVSTGSELASAVKNGGTVVLNDDITLSAPFEVPAGTDVTIDLNGKTVTATGNFVTVNAGAKLTISGGTVDSGRYIFNVNGGEVVVNGGNFTAKETACALFGGSKLTVNDGTFTSKDNAVIATNGSSADGCEITVNGGVFNANITSAGYIACGIYVANKDTVNVNAGTFNVTDGVGILMRAGHTTVGKDVVINLTNTGKVTAGKVGDANIDITTPSYLVMDVRSGYPGATAGFEITNNSSYELVEYK